MPGDEISHVLPQVEDGGFQTPLANSETMGGNVADAVMGMGAVESRLYHDANASAVTAARNAVDAKAQDQLYNPKTGLLYQNYGEKAPPEVDKVAQAYRDHVSETRELLSNDEQKRMYDRAMSEHGMQIQKTLGEYEHRQVTAGQNANTAAFIQNRQNDIAQGYHDTLFVHANIGMQRDALIDAYARNNAADPETMRAAVAKGNEPEELKEALAKADSASHMLVLNTAMSNEQNGYAKAYFEANKGQLTAGDLAKATQMVRTASMQDEARGVADGIVAEQSKIPTTKGAFGEEIALEDHAQNNLEAALANLEKKNIPDTKLHDDIQARLINHYRLAKDAHQEQQTNLLNEASDHLEDPNNANFDVPASVMGQLDLKSRRVIESVQAQKRKFGRVETDPETRQIMDTLYANPESREAFSQIRPEDYQDKFNKVEYKQLQQRVADAKGWVATRDLKLSQETIPIDARNRIFKENSLDMGGLKPGTDGYRERAAMQNRFLDQLNRWGQSEATAKKRPLTEPEWDDGAKKLFASQSWIEDRSSWNPLAYPKLLGDNSTLATSLAQKTVTGPAYLAPANAVRIYRSDEIPPDKLKVMQENDRTRGTRRTDMQLVEDYNRLVASNAR